MEQQTRRAASHSPAFIFFTLIVAVQTFMAFNGGATSATIDSVEIEDGTWSCVGIGALGAMDKLGMTLSSPLCGFLFQFFPAKTLLASGLFINAGACLVFGSLRNHSAMFIAKLLIGVTEGLQWVWAPQWIVAWASSDQQRQDGENGDARKQLWMNLNSSVVAGVGAGIGIVVAGLGTANGLSYEFAFRIEGGVLFVLWLICLPVRQELLSIQQPEDCIPKANLPPDGSTNSLLHEESAVHIADNQRTIREQAVELWSNPLFCRCALAFSFVNFVIAGIQFLWVRVFTILFDVSKTHAVLSQLIVVAAGGGAGVAWSATAKFTDAPTGKQRLRFTTYSLLLALLGAVITASGTIIELTCDVNKMLLLCVVYFGVFVTCAGLNMTPGLFQIICMQSIEGDRTRTFGTGVYQGLNNFVGFAMGPFIPQFVMSVFNHTFDVERSDKPAYARSLGAGFICALAGVCVSLFCSIRALASAAEKPEDNAEDVSS